MDRKTNTPINIINKCINQNFDILNQQINEIKELVSDEEFKRFSNKLNKIDLQINLDKELIAYKPVISNVMKALFILNWRNNVGKSETIKLFDIIDNQEASIKMLKSYILEQQTRLEQNNIEVPSFESFKFSIQSNVKTNNAYVNRIKAINECVNSQNETSEWLKNLESGKIHNIPHSILKEVSKETGTNIKVRNTEETKIFKN